MVRNSTRLPQPGSGVSDGHKHYGTSEHAREKLRNVNKLEIKGKNEVPDVQILPSLLQKCSSTSNHENRKQNCACKGRFCIFPTIFYTVALPSEKNKI